MSATPGLDLIPTLDLTKVTLVRICRADDTEIGHLVFDGKHELGALIQQPMVMLMFETAEAMGEKVAYIGAI